MRKNLITTLSMALLFFMAAPAMSQNPLERIDLGIKAGAGIGTAANFNGDADSKTGYLGGLFMNYRENRLLSLQLELLYIVKGYSLKNATVRDDANNILGQGDFEVILSYIEMPLMAKISAPLAGKYIPYLTAGGFASIRIDSKIRLIQTIPLDFDLANSNETDFGLIGGAGIDIKAGKGKVFFETRYDLGLAKAIKNKQHRLNLIAFQFGYIW